MKVSKETKSKIQKKLHQSSDIKTRSVQFFGTNVDLMYIADITDTLLMNNSLVYPMVSFKAGETDDVVKELKDKVLSNHEVNEFSSEQEAIDGMLKGMTIILVDGADKILGCDMEKITTRAVMEPPTSVVIKGPREGFTESIKYNFALIRKRVKTNDLVIKTLEIGELTKTEVGIVYFSSVADKKIVDEITKRLSEIKIDGVLDAHYLISY